MSRPSFQSAVISTVLWLRSSTVPLIILAITVLVWFAAWAEAVQENMRHYSVPALARPAGVPRSSSTTMPDSPES
jgi:hypothetical protein